MILNQINHLMSFNIIKIRALNHNLIKLSRILNLKREQVQIITKIKLSVPSKKKMEVFSIQMMIMKKQSRTTKD